MDAVAAGSVQSLQGPLGTEAGAGVLGVVQGVEEVAFGGAGDGVPVVSGGGELLGPGLGETLGRAMLAAAEARTCGLLPGLLVVVFGGAEASGGLADGRVGVGAGAGVEVVELVPDGGGLLLGLPGGAGGVGGQGGAQGGAFGPEPGGPQDRSVRWWRYGCRPVPGGAGLSVSSTHCWRRSLAQSRRRSSAAWSTSSATTWMWVGPVVRLRAT